MPDKNETLNLQGVYNTLYNATTRPDFKFAVSRYFVDEWVPVLGPSLAWLIVGLRQQCFWNKRRNWCIVDKATLAAETGLDKRTIERLLKKPISRWFVLDITHRYRYRHQLGKKVRDKNRYHLLLDEPLSPRHQMGLAQLLQTVTPTSNDRLGAALAAVETLVNMPHLTDKISVTQSNPKNLTPLSVPALVQQAAGFNLETHLHDERAAKFDRLCAQLHNLIVQPNKIYVGWQYYRLKWVPLLGHALAWLIIYLRRHCYWDESSGELRDTYTGYKKELAAAIGQTTRNLANIMNNPHLPLFFTILNPADGRNKPTRFRIRLVDEPLTPEDQQKTAASLRQQLQGQIYASDPETGQLNLFPLFGQTSTRQNFAYGKISENMPSSDPKNRRVGPAASEILPQHDAQNTGKIAATTPKDSLIPQNEYQIQKQQIPPVAAQSNGLLTLLNDLGVQEPTKSRLLANPNISVAKIGAWYLYAETQPGLFDPRSYVIKRLLADDPPPEEFLAFARLTDDTWQLFESAVQSLRAGHPPQAEIPPDLIEAFISWTNVYTELNPDDVRRLLNLPPQLFDLAPDSDKPLNAELADGVRLWQAALNELQLQMARQTFNAWLRQTEVYQYSNYHFVINAKTKFAQDWLEKRLAGTIQRTLEKVAGAPVTVEFTVVD
ncbi:MAG: hypothetical protein D6768_09000 [Chloroflexi bacterium]|nr:MAG: hypothetical protein D6768_09000 [Chloroflexota bacterium]